MRKNYFLHLFLIILLIVGCSKKENSKNENVIESSQFNSNSETITKKDETTFQQNEQIIEYEKKENKDKNGIIEISTILQNFNLIPENKMQILPLCEIISKPIINNDYGLKYSYNPDDPILPEGPVAIKDGTLYFTQSNNINFKYSNTKWEPLKNINEIPDENEILKYIPENFSKETTTYYLINNGIIFEDYRHQQFIGIDLTDINNPKIIHPEDFINWENFTSEGFSYTENSDDGTPILLKNNVLWSIGKAYYSALGFDENIKFSAKMFTGHNIFYNSQYFLIVDNSGEIQTQLLLPWRIKNSSKTLYRCKMSWKIGKYGEIYALMGPEMNKLETTENAELIVIRNHFNKYGVVDSNELVLFEKPEDDATVIAYYPENTGFYFEEIEITEDSPINENNWYKVRIVDGTNGYFKGKHIKSLNKVPDSKFPWK